MVVESNRPVHLREVVPIVGDQDDTAPTRSEFGDGSFSHQVAGSVVETREWLVQKRDPRPAGEDPGETRSGPFSTGERFGPTIREVEDAEAAHRLLDPLVAVGTVEAQTGHRHLDVLAGGEMFVEGQMLLDQDDVPAARSAAVHGDSIDLDPPREIALESGDASEKRGLPAARGAGESDDLARRDLEVDRTDAPATRQ